MNGEMLTLMGHGELNNETARPLIYALAKEYIKKVMMTTIRCLVPTSKSIRQIVEKQCL